MLSNVCDASCTLCSQDLLVLGVDAQDPSPERARIEFATEVVLTTLPPEVCILLQILPSQALQKVLVDFVNILALNHAVFTGFCGRSGHATRSGCRIIKVDNHS